MANVTLTDSAIISETPTSGADPQFYIIINPIGKHYLGEAFEITGTTNLTADSKILITITSPGMSIPPKPNEGISSPNYRYMMSSGYAQMKSGNDGMNIWSYEVNLSDFYPSTFGVAVGDVTVNGASHKYYIGNGTNLEVLPLSQRNTTDGGLK